MKEFLKNRGWTSKYSMFNTSDSFSNYSNMESSLLDDYHYYETNKQTKMNGEEPSSSSRSLFLSKNSIKQTFSSSLKNNLNETKDDLTEVQSEDEEDEELMPCFNDPSTMDENTKKQCSEKSTRKKKEEGLKAEERCGKPLTCSVRYFNQCISIQCRYRWQCILNVRRREYSQDIVHVISAQAIDILIWMLQ